MNAVLHRLLLAFALLLVLPSGAQAAITCTSITSPGFSMNYVNGTTASVQTYFAVTCTRTAATDPTSVSYNVKADNGSNPTGINNNATYPTGATLRYDLYSNAGCSSQWKGNQAISDTITWSPGSTGTITKQAFYWGCIVTGQTATASGTYADRVGVTLTYGNNQTLGTTANVAIYAPALCTMGTPPGSVVLPYVAFGAQVSQTTSYSVTCTNGMPYTMATDVPEAVLSGVRYVLGLSAASANGTGTLQSYTLTVTAPAGQAGSCASASCTATRAHTLTITY